jgi:hypothetical protein
MTSTPFGAAAKPDDLAAIAGAGAGNVTMFLGPGKAFVAAG